MQVGELLIPEDLVSLIREGIWPREHEEAIRQNLESILNSDAVHKFAPDEERIFFYPPPFRMIRDEIVRGGGLTTTEMAVWDIDPELTVIIGDFGLGSDTAIALDYRGSRSEPKVIRMVWRLPQQPNKWVHVADSFCEFWALATAS